MRQTAKIGIGSRILIVQQTRLPPQAYKISLPEAENDPFIMSIGSGAPPNKPPRNQNLGPIGP